MEIHEIITEDLTLIHEGTGSCVYRLDRKDGEPLAVKMARQASVAVEKSELYRNEFDISKGFSQKGLRKALKTGKKDGRPLVLLEWIEGRTLKSLLKEDSLDLVEKIRIAIRIGKNIAALHRENIIYKNLNCDNILISPDQTCTFIDFSIAVKSSGSLPIWSDRTEGNLSYISPEQTGRMNRYLDYRTDLYAFGVVLFELFSGRLPFPARDPSELVYDHMTRKPVRLSSMISGFSQTLSEMVEKLLNKNPEERYQTAVGVICDLENCLNQWEQNQRIDPFSLGENDISERFLMVESLFCREMESSELMKAYEEALSGEFRMIFLTGSEGTGKTMLAETLRRHAGNERGMFLSGSSDQTKRHLLYNGLDEAFSKLVDILTHSERDTLMRIRDCFQEELSGHTDILTAVFPVLKTLFFSASLQSQAVLQQEPRLESSIRSLLSFLAPFCNPLILFFDDLQWADQGTLQLLRSLAEENLPAPLLIICAVNQDISSSGYEYGSDIFPEQICSGPSVKCLHLENFTKVLFHNFIESILHCRNHNRELSSLADEIYAKTQGNPQLSIDFVYNLYQDGSLWFDFDDRTWKWDSRKVREKALLNTIFTSVSKKLDELSGPCLEILKMASCIGNEFSIHTLKTLFKSSSGNIHALLSEGVSAFLIQPVLFQSLYGQVNRTDVSEPEQYRFTHRYVRTAAYSLFSNREKRETHLTLGRLYLEEYSGEELDNHLFTVVDQLNEGFQLIQDPFERQYLSELNLDAGSKALRLGNPATAVRYLNMGIGLLPSNRWKSMPGLCRNFYELILEAEYGSRNYSRVLTIASELENHAENVEMLHKSHKYKILTYSSMGDYRKAFEASLEALESHNILQVDQVPLPGRNSGFTPDKMDMTSIIKAAHTLSQELHLDSLLEKFIPIVMENAGAEKGVLIIEEDGEMHILCRAGKGGDTRISLEGISYKGSDDVPQSVIENVIRDREAVIIGDAFHSSLLHRDKYIQKNRVLSVLGLPVFYQSSLMGVLYLENSLMANVFSQEHLHLLKVLVTQAAISIQIARLYTSLENKIQDLNRTQEELVVSRNWLDRIINTVPEPIFVKDSKLRWVLVNDALCDFLGQTRETLIGKTDYDFFSEGEADVFRQKDKEVIETGKDNVNEELITDKSGETHTIITRKTLYWDEQGHPYIVGILRDITEQVKLESQLQQKVKMEAVGRLAGGVAHDFNNMLSVIMGYSEMALENTKPGDSLSHALHEILNAATRSADITRQLLAFARKQAISPKVVDLNAMIDNLLKMIQRLIGENIELRWEPCKALWKIKIDPSQIDQILVNLCINARDAMPDGGTIVIRTGMIHFDEDHCRNNPDCLPGEFIFLSVKDYGSGMDEQTRTHIFEPFFTTKSLDKGTGLGLATVYGIINQNSGFIQVDSTPGEGTEFKLFFRPFDSRDNRDETDKGKGETHGGKERILLVEDESAILELTHTILEQLGYSVISVESANKVMDILDSLGTIDLLVSDVIMPGMNGFELLMALKKKVPGLKHLFMSGYSADVIARQGKISDDVNYIQKPFTMQELSEKVRQALDQP